MKKKKHFYFDQFLGRGHYITTRYPGMGKFDMMDIAEVIEVIRKNKGWNTVRVRFLESGREHTIETHKVWKINKKEYWAREVVEE